MLTIRLAIADDEDFLRQMIYLAANRPGPDWAPIEETLAIPRVVRFVNEWMTSSQDLGVIAEVEGQPQGAAWIRKFDREQVREIEDPSLHSLAIAMNDKIRGQGTGHAMMAVLLEEARRSEFLGIQLWTSVENVPAFALYKSVGFEVGHQIGKTIHMALNLR